MKNLQELLGEQREEVGHLREVAGRFMRDVIQPEEHILGALLTGSVARGDARHGPYGLYIDVVVVVENLEDIDLVKVFGPNVDPYLPKHCVKVEDTGVAIELTTLGNLQDIRARWESEIYARQESIVLYDKTGVLQRWKDTAFIITEEQRRDRALYWFFRFHYLVNNYRIEKWSHRLAWVQMCQNGNEAIECYCNFLYCINGWFIPRKDWLAYLTYELPKKMPSHRQLLEEVYSTVADQEGQARRFKKLWEVFEWMNGYCKEKKWVNLPDPQA